MATMTFRLLLLVVAASFALRVSADGPADNLADKVRPIPPPGLAISEADRSELTDGTALLAGEIEALRGELARKPALLELLPDVQVYHKAVAWALAYDEFFKTNEAQVARVLLRQGRERAQALREGRAPWLAATGLVVRGFVSRIDGSVQPYGLVVPASWTPGGAHRHRLDLWFHGRGETLSELDFIHGRQRSPGEFAPPDTFVLHPYGRYCNGNKFAGETDAFEALEHVRHFHPIDSERITVRGFSLGGAACWHLAVHHAWRWAAAAPGAGFSESPDFLKVFQNEKLQPAWFEQKLWHLYDCTDWAVNLAQCPTVAYSGEIDRQKQAADIMARALAQEGIDLIHVIGPKTAHSYHPEAKREINRRIDAITARGREAVPARLRFTTWTLKYNRMNWLVVDALGEHWERARVDAELSAADNAVTLATKNVTALTLTFEPGQCPLDVTRPPRVVLDGRALKTPAPRSDRSWTASFHRAKGRWVAGPPPGADDALRKRHGLQGPIDDAFLDSFLLVRPTGAAWHPAVGAWTAAGLAHATNHWRKHFRGDARVKDDTAVTTNDLAAHHLVLWGDPSGNQLLRRIADRLPVRWTQEGVVVGRESFPGATHVPALIFPNPLNPEKYVVLNSGFTFREYDYLNNARQTPKLPDWAVFDITAPVTSRAPGRVAAAGFFGEKWELPERRPAK
jgi:dienelactone hydrolase